MAYPRSLTSVETELLRWLLPINVLAYKPYNYFAKDSQVIGEGRWGEGDLILDKKKLLIDLTLGMSPVVAYGECDLNGNKLSISVHDFNIDDQLEIQFSGVFPIPDSVIVNNKWCYSYWKPGDVCPATQTQIKEIFIRNNVSVVLYVLAISPAKKVIWLHNTVSGFNQLQPLTSFYDELLRAKHIRDAKLISHPATFSSE